ncbi:MAG: hypothetical protein WA364_08700 [Candidatus Nitrosopolaris sp.]
MKDIATILEGISIPENDSRNRDQKISSSFLIPASLVLTPDAHSKQTLFEKGNVFMQSLHVGLPHVGHGLVSFSVLHR